ncbi:ABC transporter permease [Nocardioides bizhenqiangii]|uniref:ABC transporter permease n=1 Tax=Nocardioides bizhenqiangii TaxID=3095076 RepID=A0ABZ0ZUE0_9ACTN|nr:MULTISPECIES: ABC transporter permease [unclassified Nocardioides]MDZ5621768.1 ABC transporter permease [Nocardioides sp. HM23]WQQ27546.1 ABC transporter permease [Nocardioides sp. HM61]
MTALAELALHPPARRSRAATVTRRICLAMLAGLVLFALVGPFVLADPAAQSLDRYLEGPSLTEPLGRDEYGRSVVSRLAHATRLSLLLAAACVGTALLLGTATGILAGWRGGLVDVALRSTSEVFVAMPALLVVLLVAASSPDGGVWTLYLGLALAQWVEYFRVVRSRSALLLGSPAVEAARLLGLGWPHVVRRHLWPDLRPLLVTLASLGMVTSILAMSTLGFVKVGLQPPRAELGLMITESFPFYDVAPWLSLAPVAVLFILTICFLSLRRTEDS